MLTITYNGIPHTIKIKPSKHSGEVVAQVFINKDKMPYVGTWFSKITPIHKIVEWAEGHIYNYPKSETR